MNNYQLSTNNYQLPEGYQQTEVGVIPEDWETCTLRDAVEFLDGKRKPIRESERAKMRGIYPYFGASGIVDYVNDYLFDDDLILLGEDGENILSRSTRLAFRVSGKIWVNNHAHVLKPKSSFAIGFLSEYLESLDYSLHNSGTAQPKLNQQTCQRIAIVRPPLEEQRSISQALSDVDALIAALDKAIAKKRHLKTATMQQLLIGKKRLPGFGEGKSYQQTEIGVIPEDWNVMSIQAALDEKYIEDQMDGNHGELYPRSHEFVGYGVPYIGANDFLNGRVSFKNCKFLSEKRARKFKKGIARSGDVLFAHNATVGPVALLEFDDDFLILSTTATYFRCNLEKLSNLYFRFVLETQYFTKQYRAVMAQSTRFQVPITTQRKFLIGVAPIKEQRAIATVLSDMDAEIAALETRLAKTQALKQGMMQALLTGRVRLV